MVSLSGGIDSTTLLYHAIKKHGKENVTPVTFTYGSKHDCELLAAKEIVKKAGLEKNHRNIIIDSNTFKGTKSTLMLQSNVDIELDKPYEEMEEGKVATYVPARNLLFNSYLAAIAESTNEATGNQVYIYYGMHADDGAGLAYPDCTPQFLKAIAKAIAISSCKNVKCVGPFVKWTKTDIVKYAIKLKVPLEMTVSCYEPTVVDNKIIECGRCATCLAKQKALIEAGWSR